MEIVSISSFQKKKRSDSNSNKENRSMITGFPSPADDYEEVGIDLSKELIPNSTSTFFLRVSGKRMEQAGINDQDLLLVDRSLEAKPGNIVIAVIEGHFSVKYLTHYKQITFLEAGQDEQQIIPLNDEKEIYIWGVVTYSIHSLISHI